MTKNIKEIYRKNNNCFVLISTFGFAQAQNYNHHYNHENYGRNYDESYKKNTTIIILIEKKRKLARINEIRRSKRAKI